MYIKAVQGMAGADFEPIAAGAVGLVPDERGAALIASGHAEAAEAPQREPVAPLTDAEVRRLKSIAAAGGRA